LIRPKEYRKRGFVVQNEANKFYSSGAARSFIRGIADQLSEENPELMVEFFRALEIVNAALVSWLIEEKESESSDLREDSAESGEFQLAVERLKMTLAKLSDSKRCTWL
jgi:hypothetical protein